MFGPCFVVQYFMSFLVLQSSHWGRERCTVCGVLIVREPVIGLIKWLRPKGLKVCSYVEKCAKLKNQTLKKIGRYTKCYARRNTPGVCNISK